MSQDRPESGQPMPPSHDGETGAKAPQSAPIDSPTAEYPVIGERELAAAKRAASMQMQTAADNAQAEAPGAPTPDKKAGKKAKKAKKKRKGSKFVALLLVACLGVACFGGVQIGRDMTVPADADNKKIVDVEIESGMPIDAMGQMLEEEGVIRSANAFKLYVRIKGVAPNIQAGIHSVSPSMNLEEVVTNLQQGAKSADVVRVALAEGLTVDQVAAQVAKDTKYSKEDFMKVMTDDKFLKELVEDYPFLADSYNAKGVRYVLEGYLFPATYEFDEKTGLHQLVKQMLDKTESVLKKYQEQIDASDYSLQDIMSLASLIEKEGMTKEDRHLISGVFYNRLNQGMAIQSDISVLYALNTHKELVTFEDLEVDSPYNLYKNTGLPPGPLNNPSEEAIEAALNPEKNDYIYFYANLKTGKVYYTASYDQHLAWQKEYEETGDIKGENRK